MTGSIATATLASPPGLPKLVIGIMADLHLPPESATIGQYRPGTRRLPGLGHGLALRYIKRMEDLGAEMIVLPGDLVDPCTPRTLNQLQSILHTVSVPCYPLIGNHEPWTPGGEALFYRQLGLPETGYYTVRKNGILLIMLSTPSTDALDNQTAQLQWLRSVLASSDPEEDIVLFAHFSLLLHPCVRGSKNDGYQLLDNHRRLLALLEHYPNVRLYAAGHKNVPSMVQRNGIIHTLSPQLIQAPCGYDLLKLYHGGVMRTTYEIDEQHYCEVARAAYADNWPERYGEESRRNFYAPYGRVPGITE